MGVIVLSYFPNSNHYNEIYYLHFKDGNQGEGKRINQVNLLNLQLSFYNYILVDNFKHTDLHFKIVTFF